MSNSDQITKHILDQFTDELMIPIATFNHDLDGNFLQIQVGAPTQEFYGTITYYFNCNVVVMRKLDKRLQIKLSDDPFKAASEFFKS